MKLTARNPDHIQKSKPSRNKVVRHQRRVKHKCKGGKSTATKDAQKEKDTTFCPRCGSTDIFWASGLPQLWSIWDCRTCGYRGALIIRDGKIAEKIREDHGKRKAGK